MEHQSLKFIQWINHYKILAYGELPDNIYKKEKKYDFIKKELQNSNLAIYIPKVCEAVTTSPLDEIFGDNIMPEYIWTDKESNLSFWIHTENMNENDTIEQYINQYLKRLEINQAELLTYSTDNCWVGKYAEFCWIDYGHFHEEDKYYSVIYFTKIQNKVVIGGVCGNFSEDEIVRFLAIQIMDNLMIKNEDDEKKERKNERLLSNNSRRL